MRRPYSRTLVACGSAGAIAAAFGGPLTGAFYAFELILGAYTPFGLAPVGAAAIGGIFAARALGVGSQFAKLSISAVHLSNANLAQLALLGVICAAFGIAIMRGVALVEGLFRWTRLPPALQPAVGGVVVGGLALLTPAALSSGHGATIDLFHAAAPALSAIALALAVKAVASMISIGSGFRGGLFFASLDPGTSIGEVYSRVIALYFPSIALDSAISAVVGMTGLAVAIVGGPLTMSFLALETHRGFFAEFLDARCGDAGLSHRAAELRLFLRDLAHALARRVDPQRAGCRLDARPDRWPPDAHRRRDRQIQHGDLRVQAAFRARLRPMGGRDRSARPLQRDYSVPDAHLMDANGAAAETDVASLTRLPETFLVAEMNVKTAAQSFEQSESEALTVVDNATDRRVIGLLTEAHLLRRYAEELDKARRELSGETFSAG